ncbi:MAG: helix-turn-helix domain-containing protein [Candidatus Nanopelagicaceae bacterium]
MASNNEVPDVQNEANLEYLKIKQAADLLGCSTDTIRNRIEDGSLAAYRFGGRLIRVKKSDLEKLFHLIPSAVSL